ncbi:MAG: hypothetical protein JJ992_01225, partial [Planctomycetes bacterium]|nr:hypothetical protein [Planctomycetota bacterium]
MLRMQPNRSCPRRAIALLCSLLFMVALDSVQAAENAPTWKAGIASIVVTPDEPMWMAGYASRDKPSEGKVHELHAKCLAIQDTDGARLVIVTLDLIGVPRPLRDWLQDQVAIRFQIPPEGLLINASHTHCGPELRADKASLYDLEPARVRQAERYVAALQEKLLQLIGSALEDLQPARLGYTHGRAGFAMNRRLPSDGGIRNSPYPDGPVDHDVPVLRVETPDGRLRALVFGYACSDVACDGNAKA